MKAKLFVLILGSLFFSQAWADMFCPNNFNSINLGDSIAAVIAACGAPDSKTTNNKKANQPQEWTYYIANDPNMPGTMKTTIAFDASGSVINISVNGSGMSQTQICANNPIQLGDNMDAIKAACGNPTYINQTQIAQNASVPETEIVEFQYNSSPPVTLVFENGKLKERR